MKHPDIRKSIDAGRIHEIDRPKSIFWKYLIHFFSVGVVVLFGLIPYFPQFNTQNFPIAGYWLSVCLIIAVLMILRILSFDKLRRVSGQSLSENKKRVRALSEELNWPFFREQQDYTTLFIQRSTVSWERDVLIIYDGNDILINVTTYAKFRQQTLQGYFGERRAFRKVQKWFEQAS